MALTKTKSILQFTDRVTVIAPQILPEIRDLGVICIEQTYTPTVFTDKDIVYACTDDSYLNQCIRQDAHHRHLLVNTVDDPTHCDFISPAIYQSGAMTVAVSSGGTDIRQAITWRNRIKDVFENV